MRRSLQILLIRTRFTWYYILIIVLIALYSLYAIPYETASQNNFYSVLYFTGIFGGFSVVSAYTGGISVSKSDQEFLLVSAISKKDLAIGLLVVQAIGTGLLLIAVSIFALTLVKYDLAGMLLAILNLALLDIFMISIGISTFRFRKIHRVLISAGIAAWVLSFFLDFPFAPQNFISGNPLNSLLLTSPIASLSLVGALLALSSDELPIRVSTPKESKKEYKSIVSYVNYTPVKAIFMNGLTNLSYSTNSLMAGGIRTTTSKIRVRTYYIIMVVISIIYGFLAYYLIRFGVQDAGFNFVVLFGALYVGVLPQFVFNSGVMTYERAWLSFTSMEPWKYISLIIGSKIFQSVLTSIPFIVVSLVDYTLGVRNTIESILVFLILDPLLIGLYLFIVFSVSTYQITDEGFLSTRMSAAQFVPTIPLILFTVIVMIAILVPVLIIFTSLGTAMILLILTTRREYWEKRISKLVERGYV